LKEEAFIMKFLVFICLVLGNLQLPLVSKKVPPHQDSTQPEHIAFTIRKPEDMDRALAQRGHVTSLKFDDALLFKDSSEVSRSEMVRLVTEWSSFLRVLYTFTSLENLHISITNLPLLTLGDVVRLLRDIQDIPGLAEQPISMTLKPGRLHVELHLHVPVSVSKK
jgi:hypothetical protein